MIHSILFVSHFQNNFEFYNKPIYNIWKVIFVIYVAVWRVCRFTTLLDWFHFNFYATLNNGKSDRKSDRIGSSKNSQMLIPGTQSLIDTPYRTEAAEHTTPQAWCAFFLLRDPLFKIWCLRITTASFFSP